MASSCSTSATGTKDDPFFAKQGLTWPATGTLKRATAQGGGPFDLTGRTGRSYLRREGNPSAVSPEAVIEVAVTGATAGQYSLRIGATVTAALEPGLYYFDVEFEDTGTPDPDDVVGTQVFYLLVGREATR